MNKRIKKKLVNRRGFRNCRNAERAIKIRRIQQSLVEKGEFEKGDCLYVRMRKSRKGHIRYDQIQVYKNVYPSRISSSNDTNTQDPSNVAIELTFTRPQSVEYMHLTRDNDSPIDNKDIESISDVLAVLRKWHEAVYHECDEVIV